MEAWRDAAKTLRRSPGFVAISVITLGLALGVTTTTYAILDAVVNPYTPIHEPERLVRIAPWGDGRNRTVSSFDKYEALRDGTTFHESIALTGGARWRLVQIEGYAGSALIYDVSANFFSTLGVTPALGRTFRPGEGTRGAPGAVIAFELWRRGASANPLSETTITLDDRTYAVIGVMPPGMTFPFQAAVWLPLPDVSGPSLARRSVSPVVRLRPDATFADAELQLRRLAADLTATHGTGTREFDYGMWPAIADDLALQRFHLALGGAGLAVLLIACANLGNLMLARGLQDRRDSALRMALGATRRDIVRWVVVQSALIAAAGGAVGLVITIWAHDLLLHHLPPSVAAIGGLGPTLGWRVFTFGTGAAATTIVLFGLLPAMRISRIDLCEPLKSGSGATTVRRGLRYNPLVIAALALAMALLMGAGLLLRAAVRVGGFEFGYEPRGLLRAAVRLDATPTDPPPDVLRRLEERADAIPGIRDAATMRWTVPEGLMAVADIATGRGEGQLNLRRYLTVSEGFLRTLGISIVSGRDFLSGDRDVVIVDETAARALWPDRPAVGQRLKLGDHGSDRPWMTVIGVARNVSFGFERDPDMLHLPPTPIVYLTGESPAAEMHWVVARTDGSNPAAAVELARALRSAQVGRWGSVNPWLPHFDDENSARRFLALLFSAFGGFALLLAAVGLYGVLSYAVGERMREFGVRIALGATTSALIKLVLHDGVVMILAGTAIGGFLAMWGANLLGRWLYDVHPADAVSLVAAEGVLLVVAVVGCLLPALRAARANPLDVLRST